VIVREPQSSTRVTFDKYFFGDAKPTYPHAINVVESKEAYAQIRAQADSIAMVTLQTSTQNDPTMRLPVYFFISADPGRVKSAVRVFVEFIKSREGQQILSAF